MELLFLRILRYFCMFWEILFQRRQKNILHSHMGWQCGIGCFFPMPYLSYRGKEQVVHLHIFIKAGEEGQWMLNIFLHIVFPLSHTTSPVVLIMCYSQAVLICTLFMGLVAKPKLILEWEKGMKWNLLRSLEVCCLNLILFACFCFLFTTVNVHVTATVDFDLLQCMCHSSMP